MYIRKVNIFLFNVYLSKYKANNNSCPYAFELGYLVTFTKGVTNNAGSVENDFFVLRFCIVQIH
jgi:hypothetical protein